MEILGDDVDMYCDVLSHILMKTRNSEQHLQKLNERYVVIPAFQYHSNSPTPVSATKQSDRSQCCGAIRNITKQEN